MDILSHEYDTLYIIHEDMCGRRSSPKSNDVTNYNNAHTIIAKDYPEQQLFAAGCTVCEEWEVTSNDEVLVSHP